MYLSVPMSPAALSRTHAHTCAMCRRRRLHEAEAACPRGPIAVSAPPGLTAARTCLHTHVQARSSDAPPRAGHRVAVSNTAAATRSRSQSRHRARAHTLTRMQPRACATATLARAPNPMTLRHVRATHSSPRRAHTPAASATADRVWGSEHHLLTLRPPPRSHSARRVTHMPTHTRRGRRHDAAHTVHDAPRAGTHNRPPQRARTHTHAHARTHGRDHACVKHSRGVRTRTTPEDPLKRSGNAWAHTTLPVRPGAPMPHSCSARGRSRARGQGERVHPHVPTADACSECAQTRRVRRRCTYALAQAHRSGAQASRTHSRRRRWWEAPVRARRAAARRCASASAGGECTSLGWHKTFALVHARLHVPSRRAYALCGVCMRVCVRQDTHAHSRQSTRAARGHNRRAHTCVCVWGLHCTHTRFYTALAGVRACAPK